MRRSLLAILAGAAIGSVLIGASTAALGQQARSPVATLARACHNHAGAVEGDGEYSDGAIQAAFGISCLRALALVKPRYHWIYAHWREAYGHGFRIRGFRCHITPDGPNDLKTCIDGRRHFDFV